MNMIDDKQGDGASRQSPTDVPESLGSREQPATETVIGAIGTIRKRPFGEVETKSAG